jgi:hypothetical protein
MKQILNMGTRFLFRDPGVRTVSVLEQGVQGLETVGNRCFPNGCGLGGE